jgi:hypothetical protein
MGKSTVASSSLSRKKGNGLLFHMIIEGIEKR